MFTYYGDELFTSQKRIGVIILVIYSFEGFGEVGCLRNISSDSDFQECE
jgi:hypothetical protein